MQQTKRSKSPPKVRSKKKSPRADSPQKVEMNQQAPSNEQSASDLSGSGGAPGTGSGGVSTFEWQAPPQGERIVASSKEEQLHVFTSALSSSSQENL